MKYLKLIFLVIIFLFQGKIVFAEDCTDFNLLIGMENTINGYSPGSVIQNIGDLNLIKPYQTLPEGTEITVIDASSMSYLGYLTIDVSSASYNCKSLSIEATWEKLIIDGDTLSADTVSFPVDWNKGYSLNTSDGKIIITGEFDEVIIYGAKGKLTSVCLEECTKNTDCKTGHFTITPNDDGNADDVFVSEGSLIYDRNGFLVAKITQDENWKGTGTSGQQLPMGYYTIICKNGGTYNVTIIR